MYELSIKSDFAASHCLGHGYEGKCKNLHGHTWQVEIIIQSQTLDGVGMVIDFMEIKKRLKSFLEELDHTHLNDHPFFKKRNPTTENLAKYIFEQFSKTCRPLKIKKVTVWESLHASVTYYK